MSSNAATFLQHMSVLHRN